jgi:hypothetical protein
MDFTRAVWAYASTRPEVDPWLELEGSIEGITAALQDHFDEQRDHTPAILFDNEISRLFARREPVPEFLCKLADGRTIQSNLRGKQRKKARDPNADQLVNPRCCGIFCTTEAQLAPHFKDSHRMGGIFPRMIWLRPAFTQDDIWFAQDHVGARSLGRTREDAVAAWAGWAVELELAAAEQGRSFEFTAEAHATLTNELFTPFAREFSEVSVEENMHAVKMRLLEKARVFAVLSAAMRLSLRVLPVDVHFAAKLVRLFLGSLEAAPSVRNLGASVDAHQIARKLEVFLRAAGDEGLMRREMYKHIMVSKKTLDETLAMLVDREVIFLDNTRPDRAGRYVHISSPLGQEMQRVAQEQALEEAELAKALGREPQLHLTDKPAWRKRFRKPDNEN